MADYYEILGVSKDADKSEIKSAFRKKARQLHPDVKKAPDAEEKFKELGRAYEILSDDEKRATYETTSAVEKAFMGTGYAAVQALNGIYSTIEGVTDAFLTVAAWIAPDGGAKQDIENLIKKDLKV